MANLSVKIFFTCVVACLCFIVSISDVDGATCSEHKSKKPADGELLEIVPNIVSFEECCELCSAHKNCSLFFYALLAEDCQLWNSTLFEEVNDLLFSVGIVMPDGWSPSTIRPTTIPPIPDCPANNTDTNIQRPNIFDCSRYSTCVYGTWFPSQCPAHTWYNYLERRCTSSNLSCWPGSFVPTYEPTTTETITTEPPPTNATQATTTSQTEPTSTTEGTSTTEFVNPCPPTGSLNMSHPTDCSRYVKCVQGIATLSQCPDEELFDVVSSKCTSPDEAVCFTTLPTSTGTTAITPTTTMRTTTTRTTTTPTTTSQGTTTEFVNPCPPTGSLNVSHPTDCSKYVKCVQGIATQSQCPNEELFDVVSGRCTSPDQAVCFTTLPTSTGTTAITPTTTIRTTTTRTTTIPTTTNPIPTSTKKPEECPSTGTVNIPHPSDCTKYIYCVQGIRRERTCESGQKFDNKTRVCVAEADAECWNEILLFNSHSILARYD